MPSLIPGFEYDVFISYRQNDNRSGWVTEFVKNLEAELAATIKEPVTVYFDSNPHDGLLETHDVDDSLKEKLKCFIFIPILSQTYCDVKSFAWKHEFIPFKKNSSDDQLGLKIKLVNGNVASRILPVCIHDLDLSDKQLVETELGGAIRGIEFIYRNSGVIRPLKAREEDPKANLNHTYYGDQVNKVARAVKDLLNGLNNVPSSPGERTYQTPTKNIPPASRKKIALISIAVGLLGLLSFTYYYFGGLGKSLHPMTDKSIAVLPFENMNGDPEQDYFSSGIAEDILNHLTKISVLKVKSRTSTLQYKGTQKSNTEIGGELGVANLVGGSVRRVGDKLRIVVQLIDAETDVHLWSETYDRELKDILALQSEIAMNIANALNAQLTSTEKENIGKEISHSVTAYDYFLKARHLLYKSNFKKMDLDNALDLVNEALKLDSRFSRAYALKGIIWFNEGTFGVSQKIWQDSALYFSEKAIKLDPSSPDGHLLQARLNRYLGKLNESRTAFAEAFKAAPNDPDVLWGYGGQLLRDGDERGADLRIKAVGNQYSLTDSEYYIGMREAYYYKGDIERQEKLLKKAKSLSPEAVTPYMSLADLYWETGQYEKGIDETKQAEKISPEFQGIIDLMGWLYYLNGDLENAVSYWSRFKEVEKRFEDSTQTVPFRHRLGMTYSKMGRKKEADALFSEDLKIQFELLENKRSMGAWGGVGNIYYDLAVDHAYFGNDVKAVQYLDSAFQFQFIEGWLYRNDPLFAHLRNREDYRKVLKKVNDFDEFLNRAFSNAINRMEASEELKSVLK
jgi:TolB-like protein/Tfp pilus assembly protein PilF